MCIKTTLDTLACALDTNVGFILRNSSQGTAAFSGWLIREVAALNNIRTFMEILGHNFTVGIVCLG